MTKDSDRPDFKLCKLCGRYNNMLYSSLCCDCLSKSVTNPLVEYLSQDGTEVYVNGKLNRQVKMCRSDTKLRR